jgi:hypothetical protein
MILRPVSLCRTSLWQIAAMLSIIILSFRVPSTLHSHQLTHRHIESRYRTQELLMTAFVPSTQYEWNSDHCHYAGYRYGWVLLCWVSGYPLPSSATKQSTDIKRTHRILELLLTAFVPSTQYEWYSDQCYYAEYHYDWMLLCWGSLYWVLWHHLPSFATNQSTDKKIIRKDSIHNTTFSS